jgi:hypothetical protein
MKKVTVFLAVAAVVFFSRGDSSVNVGGNEGGGDGGGASTTYTLTTYSWTTTPSAGYSGSTTLDYGNGKSKVSFDYTFVWQ